MKMNIKKVATIVGSALMLGATAGMAAAAAYPAPFVSSGSANVAIVVGGNAALSDGLAASAIAADLATDLAAQTATGSTTGSSTVTGGDSIKFEKSSTKFQLGKGVQQVLNRDITSEDMKALLADGKYVDDDAEEFDFTQKINVANSTLTMFDDNDYKKDSPTIGFRIANNAEVLNYTLDFTDEPSFNKLETTDLTMMGRTYYVLDVDLTTNQTITLLDSAESTIISEGETTTLIAGGKSYEISVSYVSETKTKVTVNGQTTNSLSAGQTQKLTDGAYLGVKDVMYSAKDSGVSKVELSIGSGKLVLQDGVEVVMNDETITGLETTMTNSTNTKLSSIKLTWSADGDQFIAQDSEIVMPGFKSVKLSFAGMVFPTNEELVVEAPTKTAIALKAFPLKNGNADISLAYSNAAGTAYVGVGADEDTVLRTALPGQNITFDANIDEQFVASWTDGNDAESLLMRVTNIRTLDSTNKTTFQVYEDSKWVNAKEDKVAGDRFSIGNIELTVGAINRVAQTVVIAPTNSNTNFNTIYSAQGMMVYLPVQNTTAKNGVSNYQYATDALACANISASGYTTGLVSYALSYNLTSTNASKSTVCNTTTVNLIFSEEDKDNNPGDGSNITATLGFNTATTPEVQVTDVSGMGSDESEIGSTKVYRSFVYSALATEILNDQDPDQDTVKLVYHGGESFGELYLTDVLGTVTAGSGSTNGATQLGAITVKDSEVSSMSGKNLIVIGGSCVNSVAADLLGGAACDAAFTAKSGVKAGEALIKSFARGDKIALLVAGYNAEDTTKAATYLTMKGANTTVGAALKVTSATEATAITA